MNHDAPEQLYIQVKESLEQSIENGTYEQGQKLPSEKELCERFGVSRITVRKALELLEAKNLIYTVHGKGTFVKAKIIDEHLSKIHSFGDTLRQKGFKGYTKIVAFDEYASDQSINILLDEQEFGGPCQISLLGYIDGSPAVLYRSVLRKSTGLDMYREALKLEESNIPFSTYDLYKTLGLEIAKVNQRVLAINADETLAKQLNVNTNDALLVLESMVFGADMVPYEYKRGYYRTDRYSFNLYREI